MTDAKNHTHFRPSGCASPNIGRTSYPSEYGSIKCVLLEGTEYLILYTYCYSITTLVCVLHAVRAVNTAVFEALGLTATVEVVGLTAEGLRAET